MHHRELTGCFSARQLCDQCEESVRVRRVRLLVPNIPHLEYMNMKKAHEWPKSTRWNDWSGLVQSWRQGSLYGRDLFSKTIKISLNGPDGLSYYWVDLCVSPLCFRRYRPEGKRKDMDCVLVARKDIYEIRDFNHDRLDVIWASIEQPAHVCGGKFKKGVCFS